MKDGSIVELMMRVGTKEKPVPFWARSPGGCRVHILEGKVMVTKDTSEPAFIPRQAHTEAIFRRGSTVGFDIFVQGKWIPYEVVV